MNANVEARVTAADADVTKKLKAVVDELDPDGAIAKVKRAAQRHRDVRTVRSKSSPPPAKH